VVVSSWLVAGVVVGAVFGVLLIALNASDQPAMPPAGTGKGDLPARRVPRRQLRAAPEPAAGTPELDATGPWVRVRAAVALAAVLVTLGTVLAAVVAAVVVAAGVALVRAVS
jgi:hypothetical protein